YHLAVGPTVLPGTATQSIYYAAGIAPAAANANTVTVTYSAAAAYVDVRIAEYSGIDPANPVDTGAEATGSGKLSDSGLAITTTAADVLVAGNYVAHTTTGPGSGYTQRMMTPDQDILEDSLVSSVGSYHATAPLSNGSGWWIMQMVALRAANTSGVTP